MSADQLDLDRLGPLARGEHLHAHLLAGIERLQAGVAHDGDVQEHVLAAVGGLDEAVALERAEPLHHAVHVDGLREVDRLLLEAAAAATAAAAEGPRPARAVISAAATAAVGRTRGLRRAGIDLDHAHDLPALGRGAD